MERSRALIDAFRAGVARGARQRHRWGAGAHGTTAQADTSTPKDGLTSFRSWVDRAATSWSPSGPGARLPARTSKPVEGDGRDPGGRHGVATATGVEATARQAYEAGFNVTLATDAMTDVAPEAHEYSLKHVFPRLGETGSTQDVLDLLAKRSA